MVAHEGFREILGRSIETSFNPDVYESEPNWAAALRKSDVRHQWDPDRAITGRSWTDEQYRLEYRARP